MTALGPNGVALAPPTDIRLPAGRQDRRAVSAIFGLDPDAPVLGALRIDSNIRGVVGNVVLEDPFLGTRYRTAVPLDLEPSMTWIIPYASNAGGFATTLVLHNTAAAAASAQVRITGPDGVALGTAPARSRATAAGPIRLRRSCRVRRPAKAT